MAALPNDMPDGRLMRSRLRSGRERAMARRPGERTSSLSPRSRRVAGWIAAVAVVGGIALGVRLVGGTGDGSPSEAEGPSVVPEAARSITFGTSLDPATGLVATPSRTSRFEDGETFAYSVAELAPPTTVTVEVERIGGGTPEIVQPSSPQGLPAGAPTIAFSVPVRALLDAFGPGEYRMRMSLPGEDEPVAEGIFVIVAPRGSPSA